MATLAIRLPVEMGPFDQHARGDRLDELVQLLGDCGAPAAELATDLSRREHGAPHPAAEVADALDVVAEALVRLGRARHRSTGSVPPSGSAASTGSTGSTG